MDIKERVINYLETIYWSMRLKPTKAQENIIKVKTGDLNTTIKLLKDLDFIYDIPEDIKPLLSPYGTFYDRYNFYCGSPRLKDYDDEHLSQIICCEFFNVQQCYYSNKKLNSSTPEKVQGISILMMYHIGLVKEKMWYGQMIRNQLMDMIAQAYPNNDIRYFGPNAKACEYLYNKMIFNDPKELLGIHHEKYVTTKITQLGIEPKSWFITQTGGLDSKYYEHNIHQFYLEKLPNGTFRILSSVNKKVKEHNELVKLTEKLAGRI